MAEDQPEKHPVRQRPDLPSDQQFQLLREQVARLWDQVWWMNLDPDTRKKYQDQGFSDPIEHFYEPKE